MKSVFDVQQLLKRFGIFVYMGNRLLDLELMDSEIKDLYSANVINKEEMLQARNILVSEINKENRGKK